MNAEASSSDAIQILRWREEAIARSGEGSLVFEFTMGKEHLYFPDPVRWAERAPAWAKDKWQWYLDACRRFCDENRYPLSVVSDAHFYEEK